MVEGFVMTFKLRGQRCRGGKRCQTRYSVYMHQFYINDILEKVGLVRMIGMLLVDAGENFSRSCFLVPR